MADRMLAAQFGNKAIRLLKDGIGNRVIAYRDNKIVNFDIYEALKMEKPFDIESYKMATNISI